MSTAAADMDAAQRDAVEHPLERAFVAIVGPAGTGKSVALIQRARRAQAALGAGERALVSAPSETAVLRLRGALAPTDYGLQCAPLGDVAFEVLQHHRPTGSPGLELIDDVRAEELFARAGSSLFALEWDEFVSAELDPEITGMRAPERFAGSAFRLIRKLRMAGLNPEAFVQAALRGATAFYGRPRNFANPDLIERTAPKYRDSLRAGAAELARQHAREIDLTRILARLYEAYLARLKDSGCVTRVDALTDAATLLETQPDVRRSCARKFRFALVDDAQDLMQCDVRFLRGLFGDAFEGVTLAGDPDQRTLAFAGPRAEGILERADRHFALSRQQRGGPGLVQFARAVLSPTTEPAPSSKSVVVYRADSMRSEAAYMADCVARAIREGVPPNEIAVIARSLRCTDEYVTALLDRGVPVDPAGEGSLYTFVDVEDGLAALWSVADPYRHDWLLRNLEAPWLRLSDATIATLCGEPPAAQALLFELPPDGEPERGRRWDKRRDFRLAWNVLRGERDEELDAVARGRLLAYRSARTKWLDDERRLGVAALARRIFADTVLAGTDGAVGLDARGRFRRALIERLAREIVAFARSRPRATLHDYLLHAEHVANADEDLLRIDPLDADAVALLGVEAAKGREFAHVHVVDVRAGAFPRYYVPDTFQFSPRFGMIPQENVGDAAVAARTAKFTYFQYKLEPAVRYYGEERRALYCAVTRARARLWITASGRPTRGATAPEFLEELRPFSLEP